MRLMGLTSINYQPLIELKRKALTLLVVLTAYTPS